MYADDVHRLSQALATESRAIKRSHLNNLFCHPPLKVNLDMRLFSLNFRENLSRSVLPLVLLMTPDFDTLPGFDLSLSVLRLPNHGARPEAE